MSESEFPNAGLIPDAENAVPDADCSRIQTSTELQNTPPEHSTKQSTEANSTADVSASDEEPQEHARLTEVQPPSATESRVASTTDMSNSPTPGSISTNTSAGNTTSSKPPGVVKKKDLIRPLFSRSSTTDKVTAKPGATKSMIVETETVDASNTPSVTLPIASSSNVISNELMSNGTGLASNLASLRSKKSTIFVDQNAQITSQPASNSTFDNDNSSINGSIRIMNKRLNPAESHLNIAKSGATKADLFAAKIANAVGDASDSDSEETFVYESAPDALTTNTLPPNKTLSNLGPANPLALRKLSQRNVSMPVSSSTHHYSPSVGSHIVVTTEDPKEQGPQIYDTEEESDHTSSQDQKTLTKSSIETQNPAIRGPLFTKYNGESRKTSTASLSVVQHPPRVGNLSQLRTTTSKLFDVKGGTLRRYSGVPDDVNIEDYLDQYDEENEIAGSDYADSYHYEGEDDDDELTPLNVNNANDNLRNKMSKHYLSKRSVPNFGSTGDAFDPHLRDEASRKPRSLKGKRQYTRNHQQYQQEQLQYSPHNFYNKKRNSKVQLLKNAMCLSVTVFVLLAVGFVGGFLLATTKELQDVKIVSIDDILVSFDELLFDLSVEAYNHGLMTVEVSDVELDIFAKSAYLEAAPHVPLLDDLQGEVQTILLGSVSKFETPLEFASGFFHKNYTLSRGEIKLLHPGQNSTDSEKEGGNHKSENDLEKWRTIIKHPFDLIVRGSFKYEVPLIRSEQSVAVTKTVTVDPTDDEA